VRKGKKKRKTERKKGKKGKGHPTKKGSYRKREDRQYHREEIVTERGI
jgi:hypothetical protein